MTCPQKHIIFNNCTDFQIEAKKKLFLLSDIILRRQSIFHKNLKLL